MVSVGTTSARTLESLYYMGLRVMEGRGSLPCRSVGALRAIGRGLPCGRALEALIDHLERQGATALIGDTQIIIEPELLTYRMIDKLITNFHQPVSTLMLLVAPLPIGDRWRDVYRYALEHGFRFLSYGDSNLLEKPIEGVKRTSVGEAAAAGLNGRILRLAIPNIISNLTVPLRQGWCGSWELSGHLGDSAAIGGISIRTMLFNILCWIFSFLRMGTSGLTAQA